MGLSVICISVLAYICGLLPAGDLAISFIPGLRLIGVMRHASANSTLSQKTFLMCMAWKWICEAFSYRENGLTANTKMPCDFQLRSEGELNRLFSFRSCEKKVLL